MPIISAFFGVVIRMFYEEHEPAHFHAEHQGQRATFDLRGRMIAGQIHSRTARRLIREWSLRHGPELEANWRAIKAGQALVRIEPLD